MPPAMRRQTSFLLTEDETILLVEQATQLGCVLLADRSATPDPSEVQFERGDCGMVFICPSDLRNQV